MRVPESRCKWSMLGFKNVSGSMTFVLLWNVNAAHAHLSSCKKVNSISTLAQVRQNSLRAYPLIWVGAIKETIHADRFAEFYVCL